MRIRIKTFSFLISRLNPAVGADWLTLLSLHVEVTELVVELGQMHSLLPKNVRETKHWTTAAERVSVFSLHRFTLLSLLLDGHGPAFFGSRHRSRTPLCVWHNFRGFRLRAKMADRVAQFLSRSKLKANWSKPSEWPSRDWWKWLSGEFWRAWWTK